MKTVLKALAPLAVAATLFSATPASAMSAYCFTTPATFTCTTIAIPANASGHFIFYRIGAWTGYRIRDTQTNVFIRAASTTWGAKEETVFRLVGWYELTIQGLGGAGYISNT